MLKITHYCRRRGRLGVTYAPETARFNPCIMGPQLGIYKTAQRNHPSEIHFNLGSAGCDWAQLPSMYETSLLESWDECPLTSHWIEDRKAERARAMMELKIEQNRLKVCMDGN